MLSQSKLEAELRKILDPNDPGFVGFPLIFTLGSPDIPASRAAAADNWATAWDAYGQDAEDVTGASFLSAPVKANFRNALTFTSTTPSQLATEFAAAWAAYWTGVTFVAQPATGTEDPSCPNSPPTPMATAATSAVVTSSVAALQATLQANLQAELSILSADGAAKAQAFANLFHAQTVAVQVLITGADAASNPVTNLCHLF